MKKFSLLSLLAIFLLVSCGEKNVYTLNGKFDSQKYDGQKVYLMKPDSVLRNRIAIDSTTIQNGQFTFSGIANDTLRVRFIEVKDAGGALFLVERGNIDMSIDTAFVSTIKGTPANDGYNKFKQDQTAFFKQDEEQNKQAEELKAKGEMTPEKTKELDDKNKASFEQYRTLIYDFVKPNIGNELGEYLFINNSYIMSDEQMTELLGKVCPEFKKIERVQKLESLVAARQATAIGTMFTDIKGLTPDGKETALSNYAGKGKIVLVDFWASWCGPCIQSLPSVVELYGKYKDKGFEIVGVSLDANKEAWLAATKKHQVTWPQMSNLKAWDEPAAKTYGINYIPQVVLIDKDGKIIDRNISVQSLELKLAETLK